MSSARGRAPRSDGGSASGLRLVNPGPQHPVWRWVIELGPSFVVAVLQLPWVIAHGIAWPWQPSTIDLQVYVYAGNDMLAGKDIYATTTPGWNLYFIYPPIAAILMVPLAVGAYWLWQLIWTLLLVWAQQSVLKRCGVPRGWVLGLIGVVVVLAVEPMVNMGRAETDTKRDHWTVVTRDGLPSVHVEHTLAMSLSDRTSVS